MVAYDNFAPKHIRFALVGVTIAATFAFAVAINVAIASTVVLLVKEPYTFFVAIFVYLAMLSFMLCILLLLSLFLPMLPIVAVLVRG